ncbi:hypothetical protein [Opitutus terrae]|uniref:TRASH transcription regulator C-terminal archaeal domain-containing protein n=1 Tax=Opitutus terrae (strain DSM 11246 / JCM 15787 / PB90-1) TaxID=452637 RepID=B1ZTQ3_OPITP|nr:hypothetical protein [Opitutus terrae]ACB74839.1 hypothetical protein Oter_1555 [Opitutus terrae PB90-1]
MKSLLTLACSALLVLAAPAAFAQHDHAADSGATQPAASESIAAQKADYPLQVCAVSGEELGSMGEPFDYIHKEDGKPDRLVRMCCDGCVKKFKKDPAKYLKKIDEAAANKAAGHTASKH